MSKTRKNRKEKKSTKNKIDEARYKIAVPMASKRPYSLQDQCFAIRKKEERKPVMDTLHKRVPSKELVPKALSQILRGKTQC